MFWFCVFCILCCSCVSTATCLLSPSHTSLQMTGQSTSAPLERSTTTTAEPRSLNGRNQRIGLRGDAWSPSLLLQVPQAFELLQVIGEACMSQVHVHAIPGAMHFQWSRWSYLCRGEVLCYKYTCRALVFSDTFHYLGAVSAFGLVKVMLILNIGHCVWYYSRGQRPKEASKSMLTVNSFPKDRDYRREAMQASATSAFSSTSKSCCYIYSEFRI